MRPHSRFLLFSPELLSITHTPLFGHQKHVQLTTLTLPFLPVKRSRIRYTYTHHQILSITCEIKFENNLNCNGAFSITSKYVWGDFFFCNRGPMMWCSFPFKGSPWMLLLQLERHGRIRAWSISIANSGGCDLALEFMLHSLH